MMARQQVHQIKLAPGQWMPVIADHAVTYLSGDVPAIVIEVGGRQHVLWAGQGIPVREGERLYVRNTYSVVATVSVVTDWAGSTSTAMPSEPMTERVTWRFTGDIEGQLNWAGWRFSTPRPALVRIVTPMASVQTLRIAPVDINDTGFLALINTGAEAALINPNGATDVTAVRTEWVADPQIVADGAPSAELARIESGRWIYIDRRSELFAYVPFDGYRFQCDIEIRELPRQRAV